MTIPLLPDQATWLGSPIITPNFILEVLIFIIGLFVVNEFSNYRKQRRSEAASRALNVIQNGLDYINEIVLKSGLYQYEGYYPTSIPEIANKNESIPDHKERPSRLIANCISTLKKDFNEQVVQIAGKEAKILRKLSRKIQNVSFSLSNSIAAQLDSDKVLAQVTYPDIEKCQKELAAIEQEIADILDPIIEGRSRHLWWLSVIGLCCLLLPGIYFYKQGASATASQPKYSCISCALQRGELETIGGIIATTNYFEARQDYSVPIPGFIIIASKRHIKSIDEFTPEERSDFIEFLYALRKRMREQLGVQIVYLIQEEDATHFHLWLFPQYDWMKKFGSKIKSVKPIMQWAKEHLQTKENLDAVKKAVEKLKS